MIDTMRVDISFFDFCRNVVHTFDFIAKSKILEAYMIIVVFKINQIIFTLTSIANMSYKLFLFVFAIFEI